MIKINNLKISVFVLCFVCLNSCGTYFNQPYKQEKARIGETTKVSKALTSLPLPQKPVVVGVYKFRDQTGQYKPTENGSSFSTAVTQGGTTILIKALEDSNWFTVIERENFSNLSTERNIIRSTRKQYRKTSNPNAPQLPPLLYAGILLEGGIISYDSNIVTGGFGARYFGIGGSTQYRQDRITVYLRAVSTSSGEVLKTVYVSKTILSQALDASLFRYVKFKRLLEVETGFTKNEPGQMAVKEAIEKAVESLIIEGVKEKLWLPKTTEENTQKLIENYNLELEDASLTDLHNRLLIERRGRMAFTGALGLSRINGDLPNPEFEFNSKMGFKYFFNPAFNLSVTYNKFNLKNELLLNQGYMSFDMNLEYVVLPYDKLTPYIFVGGGTNASNYFKSIDPKIQFGLGLEYMVSNNLGFFGYAENNMVFSDQIDFVEAGKRDDMYYRFGLGINIYLFKPKNKRNLKRKLKNKSYNF